MNLRALWFACLGLGLLLLAGCESRNLSDLEQYSAEVRSRKGGRVPPLPVLRTYERYGYQSADNGARDPFGSAPERERRREAADQVVDKQQQELNSEIATHNREELEMFELDSLRMVGTLQNDADIWAIVKDSTGVIHRVTVGNYIGRNFGKILDIREDRVEIREINKDSNGRWEERAASLALTEDK